MRTEHEVDVYFDHYDSENNISHYKIKLDHYGATDSYTIWFEDEYGRKIDSIPFSDNCLSDLIDLLIKLEHQYGYERYEKIERDDNPNGLEVINIPIK